MFYKQRKKKKFFGLLKRNKETRVLQIGFPGWKRQINPKAVKNVLKMCGLFENGLISVPLKSGPVKY